MSKPADARVALRLPAKLRDKVAVAAEANHRTLSGEVRFLIEQGFAHRYGEAPDRESAA